MLSIIIPTYNEEEYLPKLLNCIKNQTHKDYEIIVADANSKDKTRQIAKKYGVFGEKVFMGNKSLGIFRTTFVLDKKHNIIRIFEQVKPNVHAQEVLDLIKSRK